jgi:hypothetical protein
MSVTLPLLNLEPAVQAALQKAHTLRERVSASAERNVAEGLRAERADGDIVISRQGHSAKLGQAGGPSTAELIRDLRRISERVPDEPIARAALRAELGGHAAKETLEWLVLPELERLAEERLERDNSQLERSERLHYGVLGSADRLLAAANQLDRAGHPVPELRHLALLMVRSTGAYQLHTRARNIVEGKKPVGELFGHRPELGPESGLASLKLPQLRREAASRGFSNAFHAWVAILTIAGASPAGRAVAEMRSEERRKLR